jgi:hypothetical protein
MDRSKLALHWPKMLVCMIVSVFLFNHGELFIFRNLSKSLVPMPKTAEATYQFSPTGGGIVTGSNPAILGATAANDEGINVGDWRGAIADDGLHFGITSTTGGYNAYLDIGGVQLNNANVLIIQTQFDLDAAAPSTLVQICDWVSSTGVHAAADSECTGGGWRNLNLNDALITTTTATNYAWQVYDGYWDSTATSSISTPLSNFASSTDTIRVRYYSTTNTTSVVHVDFLRAFAVVNPVYAPSGAVQLSGGTPTGNYTLLTLGGVGQTGLDNARLGIPGTAGSISDFYLSFDDVRTYTGANTILVRAEYSCSVSGGLNHTPKIYNFNTSAWEDLASPIACSTTDVANAWAKNNITISDYVSNGEVRIGWYGLANGTQEIRLDYIYMMIGTTNTDGSGEISFGSLSAGTVDNTRTLDMTGTASTWSILSADDSVDIAATVAQSLTFTISDTTIGFGNLNAGAARYATGDAVGSASETEAHTLVVGTNAANGYTMTATGTTLTCSGCGGATVSAIGGTNTTSSAGTEQFGMRFSASGGTGAVAAPYAAGGFAFDTAAFPDQIASASGASANTTYSARYLANIAANTEAGSYSATVTYVATANF